MPSRAAPTTQSPPIPAGLTRDQLLEIYRFLRLTRTLEERLTALYRQSKVIGGLFRSLGQEGESVGSAYALARGPNPDILSPLIRNLGSMLVMGAEPIAILRQYMAKAESPTHGRELNVHFNDLAKGYLGQISHLGDMVPVMAGIALTFKLRGEPRVGLVYVGDGATSTGTFHEGLNFAAVQKVPLVVIAEYNRWAYSTPRCRRGSQPSMRFMSIPLQPTGCGFEGCHEGPARCCLRGVLCSASEIGRERPNARRYRGRRGATSVAQPASAWLPDLPRGGWSARAGSCALHC